MKPPLADSAIGLLAEAIFKEGPSAVVEADSSPGQVLCEFRSAEEFCVHVKEQGRSKRASAHMAILYPDMAGLIAKTRIDLHPNARAGSTFRYKAVGWGLIWLHLEMRPSPTGSFVSANSEQRAHAWAVTHPEWESPEVWNWPAVARHVRRLRRVLKQVAS